VVLIRLAPQGALEIRQIQQVLDPTGERSTWEPWRGYYPRSQTEQIQPEG
jgi:hypothetical protein